MAERELHYFARGNTAAGMHSLVKSVFQGVRTLYVLQGYPGGTAEILGRLASEGKIQGWTLQLIHQPLDSDLLEGLIIDDLSVGLVDGAAWGEDVVLEETETVVRFIDLRPVLAADRLAAEAEAIQEFEREISALYDKAYATFLQTLRIHDEWEKFYIDNLDRDKMDQLAADWSHTHLTPDGNGAGTPARVIHRFLGAATWRGAVDFVPNLTDRLDTRIFVKGRPGSGKSTLFRKIAAVAEERGIDTEVYHCGFDPGSLDMLIFPDLSLAIFDSTAPHEHFPVREGDHILDVYEMAITPGTDEKYADSIRRVKERYTASMKESISLLAEVKEIVQRLEGVYRNAANEQALNEISGGLFAELSREVEVQNTVSS